MRSRTGTTARPAALALASLLFVLACARAGSPGNPRPATQLPPPPITAEQEPSPAPPAPPPDQIALMSAREAESRGDHLHAADLYDRALAAAAEPHAREEIRFELALLRLGPDNPQRDPEAAQRDLEALVQALPEHRRTREARALLKLLEEAALERQAAAALKEETEALKAQVLGQKAELEAKEQELQRIKQVLLQSKP